MLMSKGVRLFSAREAVTKMKKPSGWMKMNHSGAWASTMSERDMLCAKSATPSSATTNGSS